MGLDVGKARWSYSGFGEFRHRLCEQLGIKLSAMRGFGGETPWALYADEPLVPLLDHSDCDGELTPEQCATVAPRLRELVDAWEEDDYDRIHAIRLTESMEECAANNEPLEFH